MNQLDEEREKALNAKTDAKASKEELKRLRKELLRAKEDMTRLRQNGHVQQVRHLGFRV